MMALCALSLMATMAIAGVSGACHGRDGGHRPRKHANVLAAGKVASSPSSPCSAHAVPAYAEHGSGWLRRSLALRYTRWPHVRVGDGQTDASGGGSGLRMMAIARVRTAINQRERKPRRLHQPDRAPTPSCGLPPPEDPVMTSTGAVLCSDRCVPGWMNGEFVSSTLLPLARLFTSS